MKNSFITEKQSHNLGFITDIVNRLVEMFSISVLVCLMHVIPMPI